MNLIIYLMFEFINLCNCSLIDLIKFFIHFIYLVHISLDCPACALLILFHYLLVSTNFKSSTGTHYCTSLKLTLFPLFIFYKLNITDEQFQRTSSTRSPVHNLLNAFQLHPWCSQPYEVINP